MLKAHNTTESFQIESKTWILAAVSVALMLYACFFSIEKLEQLRREGQLTELRMNYQLAESDGNKILEDTIEILKPQGLARLIFKSPDNSDLQTLLSISKLLETKNYSEVITIVEQSPSLEKFSGTFKELKVLDSRLLKLKNEELLNNKESKEIEVDFIRIRNELSTFFGLSPDSSSELSVYKEGVLSGLPVLSNIPDNIPETISLVAELEKQSAKITFPAELDVEEQRSYYEEKLEFLKDNSFNLTLRHEANKVKAAELKGAISALEAEISIFQTKANTTFANLSLQVANSY